MEKKGCFNRMYHSGGGRALTALLLTALTLAFVLLTTEITFYDNDDTNIQFALAGYMTGQPYPAHPFINVLLGYGVSFCYRLFPAAPWWLAFQLAAVVLGAFFICVCLLKAGHDGNAPFIAPLVACGAVLSGFCLYAMTLVTFTLTSAVVGAGGVALILTVRPEDESRKRHWRMFGAGVCLGLSFLFRNSSGLVVLCFAMGGCAFLYFRACGDSGGHSRRETLCFTGALVCLSLALMAVNQWGIRHYNDEGFSAFDQARGEYMDYPHDSIVDNPELFASVEWDSELYVLVNDWFFMDERVNAQTLDALVEGSAHVQPSLKAAAECWRQFYQPRPIVRYLLCILLGAALAVPGAWLGIDRKKRKRPGAGASLSEESRPDAAIAVGAGKDCADSLSQTMPISNREIVCRGVFACLMLLGGTVLCGYLCWTGRLVLRVFQLILFPCAASLLVLTVGMIPKKAALWARALCLAAALLMAVGAYKSMRTVMRYDSGELLYQSRQTIRYVMEHPENVYIRDTHVANNVDAVATYPEEKPVNLLDWGGTGTLTGAKQLQIKMLGLGNFTPEVFRRENVYYIGGGESLDKERFERYLQKQWNAVLIAQEVITGDVTVYRVEFEG